MFHAAVIYKRMEMIYKIIEHGAGRLLCYVVELTFLLHIKLLEHCYTTEIISEPTEDEHHDTPLILAVKYFAYFVDPDNLTKKGYTGLDVVNYLIKIG